MSKNIVIYGANASPPVRSVLLTAETLGLNFEFKYVKLFSGEHLTQQYLKMNPKHSIPVLKHDDLILCDSHAIMQYLVDQFAPNHSLYPSNLAKRSLINERLFFDAEILYPRLRDITYPINFLHKKEIDPYHVKKVKEAYDFLNTYLSKTKWVAGRHCTIADFSCLPTVTGMDIVVPIDNAKYPFVSKWIYRCSTKWPTYQKCQQEGHDIYSKLTLKNMS